MGGLAPGEIHLFRRGLKIMAVRRRCYEGIATRMIGGVVPSATLEALV
jgi:hypothetical protein